MKRLLITGGKGQLGQSIQDLAINFKVLDILPTDIDDLDISDRSAVQKLMTEFKPDILINCAAYTAVDNAEKDIEAAFNINSRGPAVLARQCAELNVPLIHVSTDYVFSGNAERPYREDDAADPVTVYGKSKLDGEKKVLESGVNSIIIRTSWLYSEYGNNFLKTMIGLGKSNDKVRVVADQIGSPTYAGTLASGIIHIINYYPDEIKRGIRKGIYHFSNTGECSWHEFAVEIMRAYGLDCNVEPVGTEEFPRPAPRPVYSVLNTDRFAKEFNYEIPDWKTSLKSCIGKLKN